MSIAPYCYAQQRGMPVDFTVNDKNTEKVFMADYCDSNTMAKIVNIGNINIGNKVSAENGRIKIVKDAEEE